MALIACPECNKEISDRAVSCPNCGNPMAASSPAPTPIATPSGSTVTTQATGKEYKTAQLIGAGLVLLGMVSCAAGSAGLGGPLTFFGLIAMLVGYFGAWWDHG